MYLFHINITRDIPKTFKANQSYPPIATRYHKSRTHCQHRLPSSGFPTKFILIFYRFLLHLPSKKTALFLLQLRGVATRGLPPGCIPATPPDLAAPQSSGLCPLWSSHGRRPRGFSPKCGCLLVTNGFFFGNPGRKVSCIYWQKYVYIYIYMELQKKVWRKFDRWWIAKSLDCCRIIELLHVWSQFLEGK